MRTIISRENFRISPRNIADEWSPHELSIVQVIKVIKAG
jgi:hypothetical protein